MAKKYKDKEVNFELISSEHPIYGLLDGARREWHEKLSEARIALAWRLRLKPDVDCKIVLGKCVKISDLQKELAHYDFIIVLNQIYWDDFSEKQRLALLDHELCHAAPSLNRKTGDQLRDARDRPIWRVRKHDIEEFACVVERHGMWKGDLQLFAQAIDKHRDGQGDLFEPSEPPKPEDVQPIGDDADPEPGDEMKITIEHDGEKVSTTGRTIRKAFEKAALASSKPKRKRASNAA